MGTAMQSTEGTVVTVLSHTLGDLLSEEQLQTFISMPGITATEDLVDRWLTGDRMVMFEKADVRYLMTFKRKKMHGAVRYRLSRIAAIIEEDE